MEQREKYSGYKGDKQMYWQTQSLEKENKKLCHLGGQMGTRKN
jgi:hypothetical protein